MSQKWGQPSLSAINGLLEPKNEILHTELFTFFTSLYSLLWQIISQILVSSICTTPPTYKRKPYIKCQVKIDKSKPTPYSHNLDLNQSLLWSWSSSWKIIGEREIDSLFGLYERRTSYPRTFNGQNVFQKESGKSAMYAVVNALNEQVGWRVGPLEVKVCSLVLMSLQLDVWHHRFMQHYFVSRAASLLFWATNKG